MSDGNAPQAPFHQSPAVRAAVVLFVAWHMLTVAAFAMPVTTGSQFLRSARSAVFPVVSPYGYFLSQWQDWRMFVAPDPFTYTERRTVEVLHGSSVIAARFVGAGESGLADVCASARPGDRVRIVRREYFSRTGQTVTDARLSGSAAATDTSLEWFELIDSEASCPSSH